MIFVAGFCSCKKTINKEIDTLEIYTAQFEGDTYRAGDMTFYQTSHKENNMLQRIEILFS